MTITFYGVRGSIATPLQSDQIQSKISAILSSITPKDVESEDAKQLFLARLSKDLFGTVGGNSACVEVITDCGEKIIFDAGTGIRVCGKKYAGTSDNVFHLLFSHFHWDHIQGLPFFDPAFNPTNTIHIYSAFSNAEKYLREQMKAPYFPVTMDSLTKNITYTVKKENEPFVIGGADIVSKKMFHPGSSYAFSVSQNGKKFIYATDVELKLTDFEHSVENDTFFSGADVLVLDSQYTVDDAIHKENWGHSIFCYAIDFAHLYKIKDLYLFHHEPDYDDKKLHSILKSARWYAKYIHHDEVTVYLATEGIEITL